MINISRSVAFLTSFVMIIFAVQCYVPRMFPKLSISKRNFKFIKMFIKIGSVNYVACVLPGLGIAFEQPHKRTEITYFCLPKTLEALWNALEKRHLVKTLPGQQVRIITAKYLFR